MDKFVFFSSKNSWKHVVSSIIVVNSWVSPVSVTSAKKKMMNWMKNKLPCSPRWSPHVWIPEFWDDSHDSTCLKMKMMAFRIRVKRNFHYVGAKFWKWTSCMHVKSAFPADQYLCLRPQGPVEQTYYECWVKLILHEDHF